MVAERPSSLRSLARTHARRGVGRFVEDANDVVLQYHTVGTEETADLSVAALRRHIEFLTEEYQVVDLRALSGPEEPKRVALTFDDGTADFYRNVLPLLEEFEVPATVFVIADGLRDEPVRHDRARTREYLAREQVRDLVDHDLVRIGNHTRSHRRLAGRSMDEQTAEIRGAKRFLEDTFDCVVERFAYPEGAHDAVTTEVVADTHDFAVTAGDASGRLDASSNRLLIPRIDASTPLETLRWRIHDASSALRRPAAAALGRQSGNS